MSVEVLPALLGAIAGAAAGWGIRQLLGSLRRGLRVRPGPLEVATAVVTGVGVGLVWPGPTMVLVVWAGLLFVALGAVDIVHHRLPDALTLPAIPITVALVGAVEFAAPATGDVVTALVVAAVASTIFWGVAMLAPRAIGLGDVKLVPSLTLMTGYVSVSAAVLAVLIAFMLGALLALLGLASRRLTLTSAIPFGPPLLAGCWLVLAFPALVTSVIG